MCWSHTSGVVLKVEPRHRDRWMQKEYEVKRGTGRWPAEDKGRPWASSRSASHGLQLGGEAWGWLFPRAPRRKWSHAWCWTSSLWNCESRRHCCFWYFVLAVLVSEPSLWGMNYYCFHLKMSKVGWRGMRCSGREKIVKEFQKESRLNWKRQKTTK